MSLITALKFLNFTPQQCKALGDDVALTLTATGNNSQSNAYQITTSIAEFSTVTSSDNSAKLPQAIAWLKGTVIVSNTDAADDLRLFPYSGDSFNELAANTVLAVPPGAKVYCTAVSTTKWLVLFDYSALTWLTWTPTFSASGAMTYTTVTATTALYQKEPNNKLCRFHLVASGTTGGVASNTLIASLPTSADASFGNLEAFASSISDGGNRAGWAFMDNTTEIKVRRYDDANFGLGAGRAMRVSGFFRMA